MAACLIGGAEVEYFNKLKKAKAAASPHKPTFADGARLPCAFPVHSINKEASRPRTLSSKPIAPNETMLRASLVLLALIAAHGHALVPVVRALVVPLGGDARRRATRTVADVALGAAPDRADLVALDALLARARSPTADLKADSFVAFQVARGHTGVSA